jgi:bacterioferritin (cytochrome b1)
VKIETSPQQIVQVLNHALGWELRAAIMYAHYAAYLVGRDRLDFEDHFNEESTESMGHAKIVRQIIADLDGQAVTAPDPTAIVHTTDIRTMLQEAFKTEEAAETAYRDMLGHFNHKTSWHHALRHIMMSEEKSQLEITRLLKKLD